MTHRIHRVVILMAMERPVSRVIRDEFHRPRRPRRHIHGRLRPPRAPRERAAIRPYNPPTVAVEVNGMTVHAEIGKAHPHSVVQPND